MTEEQIKQNAWNDLGRYSPCDENEWIDGYIIGAHSRDEEIKQLRKALSSAQQAMAELAEIARNPWISVEERLPERTIDKVICKTLDGSTYLCFWDGRRWCSYHHDLIAGSTIIHWMPIPELKKGE